jgi:hypothetical protein
MTVPELHAWLMRTALEKILYSKCLCGEPVDELGRVTCCPYCLARDTLKMVDGHVPLACVEQVDPRYIGV